MSGRDPLPGAVLSSIRRERNGFRTDGSAEKAAAAGRKKPFSRRNPVRHCCGAWAAAAGLPPDGIVRRERFRRGIRICLKTTRPLQKIVLLVRSGVQADQGLEGTELFPHRS